MRTCKLAKAHNLTTGQLIQFGRYGPVGGNKSKSFSLQNIIFRLATKSDNVFENTWVTSIERGSASGGGGGNKNLLVRTSGYTINSPLYQHHHHRAGIYYHEEENI